MDDESNPTYDDRVLEHLMRLGLRGRLLFYLLLKAYRRNSRAFKSGDSNWADAVSNSAAELSDRVVSLVSICSAEPYDAVPRAPDHIELIRTRYSLGGLPRFNLDALEAAGDENSSLHGTHLTKWVRQQNAAEVEGYCDVILTDPPYGFNTDEDPLSLGELYLRSLEAMLGALRPGTDCHLIVCLPEQSFVGRATPWYTRRPAYVRQVFALVDRYDREVIRVGQVFPSHGRTAGPPYYWQSDRALRRSILHFVLRPAPSTPDTPTESDLTAPSI